jgi:hypothetical protein
MFGNEQSRTYGSVRGAGEDERAYREQRAANL